MVKFEITNSMLKNKIVLYFHFIYSCVLLRLIQCIPLNTLACATIRANNVVWFHRRLLYTRELQHQLGWNEGFLEEKYCVDLEENNNIDWTPPSVPRSPAHLPSRFVNASTIIARLICLGFPSKVRDWIRNAPTIAPAFLAAALIAWHVDLTRVGNSSAGNTKVVLLGPKFAKKNVNPHRMAKSDTLWLCLSLR